MLIWELKGCDGMANEEKKYTKEDILEMLADKKPVVKNKKKDNFTKHLVVFIIFLNIVFAIAIMWLVFLTSYEPSALVVAFYSFTTVQLWNMAFIKKQKEMTKRTEISTYNEIKEEF